MKEMWGVLTMDRTVFSLLLAYFPTLICSLIKFTSTVWNENLLPNKLPCASCVFPTQEHSINVNIFADTETQLTNRNN